jgi:hypothetical protein
LKNKEAISIFDAPNTINVNANYDGDTKTMTCQLGINEQWNNQNLKNVGLNFPPVTIKVDSDYNQEINAFAPRCPITKSKNWLNYYSGEEDCVYVQSIEWSISESSGLLRFIYINNPILQNMSYPVNTDGNVIYPMPLDSVLEETEFNELIIKTDEGNFLSAHSQNKEPVLGYYLYSISELDSMFLMQTGMYGKNENYIYGASINNNVTEIGNVVANTLDLQFLGAFPTMALFWSKLDKSIYMFTGDNNLRKLKEAYKVDTIGAIYCDPSKLTLIISTNIGLLILYQDQVITLDDFPLITGKGKIYYDNNCYFIGDKVIAFSNVMENATARPIHVQTEFYGAGNCVKSVNDCVYIRIGKNNLTEGYLKIKAHTLTEITKVTTEQMFTFNDTMFDSVSDQMYIQYQPQLQAGVGFSLEIESSHPISYLAISHTPEAIQQAIKYKPNVIESPTSTPNKNFSFE